MKKTKSLTGSTGGVLRVGARPIRVILSKCAVSRVGSGRVPNLPSGSVDVSTNVRVLVNRLAESLPCTSQISLSGDVGDGLRRDGDVAVIEHAEKNQKYI